MKNLFQSLALLLVLLGPRLAGASPIQLQSQDKNLADEQNEASRFLDDLARGKNTGFGGGRQVSYGANPGAQAWSGQSGPLDFKSAGKSAYQTNQTLDAMTALSLAGLQAIGTPAQGASADRLSAYGQQLSQSGSPALAQAGGNLQDQAAAMNSGDLPAAQAASQSLQSMPRMSLPGGYRPSNADNSWDAALKTVGTEFMASFASSAGEAAVSALASSIAGYFSKTGKGDKGGFWASMFGGLGGKVGKGIVKGTNSPGNVAQASMGIAGKGGSALGVQAGSGGTSTQSGGLPSMTGSSLPGATAPSGSGVDTTIKANGGGSASGGALPGSK